MFATDNEIERRLVDLELESILESGRKVCSYSDWMDVGDEVERRFAAPVRAAAFRRFSATSVAEFALEDPYVSEFIFASLATIPMPGDPVWGFLVGPPSGMKTEHLRWLNALPCVFTVSRLTPHSLISGLKGGKSLLPELDGKVLVIKDFTTILEGDRKGREEIFAQLRDAFDGYYEGYYGSVGKVSFDAHFHILAAVTSAIEEYYSVQSFLGPRFLKVRVPPIDGFERSLSQGGREDEIRAKLSNAAATMMSRTGPEDWRGVVFSRTRELKPIVELLARGRTHVSRFEGHISLAPEPEMLPRLAKQFRKLAIGRALIYGRSEVDESDMRFLRRVSFDTLPANRANILGSLRAASSVDQIARHVRLPLTTVYRHIEDLEALGLVSGDGSKPEKIYLAGPASQAVTPHSSEKTGRSPPPKDVGGSDGDRAAESGSWQELPTVAE